MSEKKNIDRLFQEKFKDFESEPSELAWQYIEARLEKKRDRKIIPLWFRLTGAAAVLLIGLAIIFTVGDNKNAGNSNNTPVVSAPESTGNKGKDENGAANGLSRGKNTTGAAVTATDDPGNVRDKTKANQSRPSAVPAKPGSVGSSASGLPQTSDGVAVYPAGKQTGKNTGAKSRKAGAANDRSTHSPAGPENESRYASTSGNVKRQQAKQGNTASVKQADGLKITHEATGRNNINQIAVNENNQSGQTQQHNKSEVNKSEVTEKTTTSTRAIAAKAEDTKKDSTALAMAEEPNALEELLKEKENKSVTENEPKINRWQITSNVAPIYLSSTSEGSPIDSRFSGNDKEYKTNLSYGLGLSYAVSKKLSVRTGVNSISLEYNTNDVEFSQTSNARQLEHVNMNLQGSMLDIRAKGESLASAPELGTNGNITQKFDSSITQKTGYIEVPVELAYQLLDKRIGIEVIGGFSTLFLNENEVSLISSDTEMQIGKANNLNSTHFSTNLGIGFKYNFFKSFQFNLEPKLKYQINTYTESGNFNPFLFGIYTGLNYRF